MSSYEETFCILQPCFVYRIPPRSSTEGYKAADWNLEQPVWQGKLSVKSRGDLLYIQLEDQTSGQAFAKCTVIPDKMNESVEPVLDSSRYYVLRIEDERTQRHAFIGMGFHERDQSFEFKACLQDYKRRLDNEKRLREMPQKQLPKLNLSLKEGETIHVDIKTGGLSTFVPEDDDGDDGDMFLPPPPSGNKKISSMSTKSRTVNRQPSSPSPTSTPSTKTNAADPFGIMSSPQPSSPQSPMGNNPLLQPTSGINFSPQHSPSISHGGMRAQPVHSSPMQAAPQMGGRVPLSQMPPAPTGTTLPKKSDDPFASLVNF